MATTTDERPSCEERIADALERRVEDLREILEALESDDRERQEEAHTRAHEYGLGIDVKRVVRWQLSWGGPSDEIEFHIDQDNRVERIEYVFKDWWDGARTEVTGEARRVLERFYEYEFEPFIEAL